MTKRIMGIVLLTLLLVVSHHGSVSAYEVIIENNERTLVFTEVPMRAVTLNQHVTEVMLALGLADHMVGTAYLDDQILPRLQEDYDRIPVLSDRYPSKEVFLSVEPDFAYAGWVSAFRDENVGSFEQLQEFGVTAYLHHASSIVGPSLDDVFLDIRNIAEIFDVVEQGEQLIYEIGEELVEVQGSIPRNQDPLRVFVYDSGETTPFTVGRNFLNSLITMAGAVNIFADVESNWASVSWEEVVNRNPEVIVIVDYGETTVEQKRNHLLHNPMLTSVEAIEQERFIVIPLSAAAEGVRAPLALRLLVEGLYN